MKQKIIPKILQELGGPFLSCRIVFLIGIQVIEIHCYLIGKLFEYLYWLLRISQKKHQLPPFEYSYNLLWKIDPNHDIRLLPPFHFHQEQQLLSLPGFNTRWIILPWFPVPIFLSIIMYKYHWSVPPHLWDATETMFSSIWLQISQNFFIILFCLLMPTSLPCLPL